MLNKKIDLIEITEFKERRVIEFFIDDFVSFANILGYDKIKELQKEWWERVFYNKDKTVILQAHRNSYKTTTIILSVVLLLLINPKISILIVRKNEELSAQLLNEVKKILQKDEIKYLFNKLYKIDIAKIKENVNQIDLKVRQREPSVYAIGLGKNLTGAHFDVIICDDIVSEKDRYSKKERETTKNFYYELRNILKTSEYKKIILIGTPWHREDLFSTLESRFKQTTYKYNIYQTKIFTNNEIKEIKESMPLPLFACNYELRHINEEDNYFNNFKFIDFNFIDTRNYMHIDTAFDGSNYTAITILTNTDSKIIVTGWVFRKNTYEMQDKILDLIKNYNILKCYIESNADKGIIARELQKKSPIPIIEYTEHKNKHIKIITTIKKYWNILYFCEDCQKEYLSQISEYSDFTTNDDAPDSLASLLLRTQKPDVVLDFGRIL